jgi:hypothetical protein
VALMMAAIPRCPPFAAAHGHRTTARPPVAGQLVDSRRVNPSRVRTDESGVTDRGLGFARVAYGRVLAALRVAPPSDS